MKYIFKILIYFALANPLFAVESFYLTKLDAIVTRAGSAKAFFSNPELLDEYYKTYLEYVGGDVEKFKRTSFDKIVSQVNAHIDTMPTLEKRLWETTGLGESFEIPVGGLQGYKVNEEVFMLSFGEWILESIKSSQIYFEKRASNEQKKFLENLMLNQFGAIEGYLDDLRKGAPSKRKLKLLEQDFFKELMKNSDLNFLSDILIVNYIFNESSKIPSTRNSDFSTYAYFFIDLLNKTHANPRLLFKSLNIPENLIPSGLFSVLKSKIPNLKMLESWRLYPLEEEPNDVGAKSVVKIEGAARIHQSKVSVVAIPRRLHGVWKGLPLKECIAGLDKQIENCTIERWGTVLSENTWMHFVEIGKHFDGFIQSLPVSILSFDNQRFVMASVDFAAWPLMNKIYTSKVNAQGETEIYFSFLIEEVIKNFQKQKPESWNGFLLTNSHYNDHAKLIPEMRHSKFTDNFPLVLNTGFIAALDEKFGIEIIQKWTGPSLSKKYANFQNKLIFNGSNNDSDKAWHLSVVDLPGNKPIIVSSERGESQIPTALDLISRSKFFGNFLTWVIMARGGGEFFKKLTGADVLKENQNQQLAEGLIHDRALHRDVFDGSGLIQYFTALIVGSVAASFILREGISDPKEFSFYFKYGVFLGIVAEPIMFTLTSINFSSIYNANKPIERYSFLRRFLYRFHEDKYLKNRKYFKTTAIPTVIVGTGFHLCMNYLMK